MSLKEISGLGAPVISLDKLEFCKLIGRGGFSEVYRGKLLTCCSDDKPTTVAIKEVKKDARRKQFENEVSLLHRFKHHNIVSLEGFCKENGRQILVLEHLPYGSLDAYLIDTSKHKETLTWVRRLNICIGVAKGLFYLHNLENQQSVVHRDIKSQNILIDSNWEPKIIDFGLSKLIYANQSSFEAPAGTLEYLPDDHIESGLITTEIDVYSFGVVMFELLWGKLGTFEHTRDKTLPQKVKSCLEVEDVNKIIDQHICNDIAQDSLTIFLETANECVQGDRRERPSMAMVLENLHRALAFQMMSSTSTGTGTASTGTGTGTGDEIMYWLRCMPRGYLETLTRSRSRHFYVDYSPEECYNRLSQGMLVDDGKMFFSLSKSNGKICQMVSASEIFTKANLVSTDDISGSSRFSEAAEIFTGNTIDMECRIKSEMLSPDTTYAAHLVLRVEHSRISMFRCEYNFKALDNGYMDIFRHISYRDGSWRKLELWQFVNNGKNVVFEFELNRLSTAEPCSVIIEGIEFRPLDYQHEVVLSPLFTGVTEEYRDEVRTEISVSDATKLEEKLESEYEVIIQGADNCNNYNGNGGIKEAYELLRFGVFIDNGKKWFCVNKLGKRRYMVSAAALLIQEGDIFGPKNESGSGKCFSWMSRKVLPSCLQKQNKLQTNPPTKTPQRLRSSGVPGGEEIDFSSEGFTIHCKIKTKTKTKTLSMDTKYDVYLVFRHDDSLLHYRNEARTSLKFDGLLKQTFLIYFDARSVMLTLENDQVDGISIPVMIKNSSSAQREVCICKRFLVTEGVDEIVVGIHSEKGTRCIVQGIIFQPIEEDAISRGSFGSATDQ